MKLDTKVIRRMAETIDANRVALTIVQVIALCRRVEELEKALGDVIGYAILCVNEEPTTLGAKDRVEAAVGVLEGK